MKSYRNLIISLILPILVLPGLIWARPVDKQAAEKAIKGWLKTDGKPLGASLGKQIERTEVFSDADGQPVYYIVYLNPTGFVIVSADDLVEPVVGFVAGDAHYDPSSRNPLGALVSRDLPGRIDIARKLQKKLDAGVQKKDLTEEEAVREDKAVKAKGKWSKFQEYADSVTVMSLPGVSDVRVAPLVQSKWDQLIVCDSNCYNYYTPNNYYCGCVATAMAQLMRYWQRPTAGIGVHSFTIYVDGSPQDANTRGGDGLGGPYVWSQMPLVPDDCSITDAQRQAIGALCYDAGVTVNMQYTSSGSGAYMGDVKPALVNTFYYANAVFGGSDGIANIGAGLNGMINPNLDAGGPVLLGIYKGGVGGHAIVADGYGYNSSMLYHHLNMGWSGLDDAWYNLPNIDSSPPFNTVRACIYNVYTSGSGEIISGRVTDASGNPISGAMVTATGPGGPYTATSNSNGIYALAKVRSASTYTVSVIASGYSFTSQNVTTGISSDGQFTSGNKSGVDFVSVRAGKIVGWGWNVNGQATPPDGNNFIAIAAGGRHSLALKSDGSIVGWGGNWDGQATPPEGNDFIAIAAGGWHSLALKSDGSIVGWGWNGYGQAMPPTGKNFLAIAAGYEDSLALKSDGSIVGWGWNDFGQATPPAGNDFLAIAAGGIHSLALKSDGSIVGWGSNYYGSATPPLGNNFIAIAAGEFPSLALKSDGSIVGWGKDDYSQATPPDGNNFIAIAAGSYHSLALKSDGSIVGWGDNYYGQATPLEGNDFTTVAAGEFHSLALETVPVPIQITDQPDSQTVCVGGSVQFCVTATGSSPLSYQWEKDGSPISGATSSCYPINPVNTGHAGSYTCVVSNSCGSVESNPAMLTVLSGPVITQHPSPASLEICAGHSHEYCVVATGTGLSYQWQKDGDNILGATSSCYTATQSGTYCCRVSNSCNSATSNPATLTVISAPAGDINSDCRVDFADLTILAEQWLQPPGIPSADIAPQPNGDGIVNFLDFALMTENWMK